MIKYKLICKDCKNIFDSWFSDSKEYEKLRNKKYLNEFKNIYLGGGNCLCCEGGGNFLVILSVKKLKSLSRGLCSEADTKI